MTVPHPGPPPATTLEPPRSPVRAGLRRRRLLAAVAAGAGAVTTATGLATATAASPVPLCPAGQLRPALVSAEAGMGHVYLTYRFTNVGGTCHTRGWVGAQLFGTDGRPLPTQLSREDRPAPTLTLAHNATTSWMFGYINPGMLDCHPPESPALIITPPGNTVPVLETSSFSPCHGQFAATPLEAGG